MMGMGFVEIAILFILLGNQGNIGVPLGIPPAEEVQLMSDVAPENCLFYASWATAGKLDGEKNPTERWFAQPKIQAAWSEIQNRLLVEGLVDEDFEAEYQKQLAKLVQVLASQAIVRSTVVFVETAPRWESLSGGCVIYLDPGSVTQIATDLKALQGILPEDWKPRQFDIEGSSYQAFTPDDSPFEISIGLRGQFAIIGFGPDAIAKIDKKVRTAEPAWLSDLKQKLPVQRRSSISRIDIRGLLALVQEEPWWSDFAEEPVKNILRLDSLVAFESVCGLDEKGFISRHRLTIDGTTPVGLAALFDAKPLSDADLKSLSGKHDWATGVRLSIPNALTLIEQFATFSGESWDDMTSQFKDMYGLRLKEDVLDHLDGSILIHGNLDSGNPTGDWMIQIGISDEMSFFDNLQTFNEKLAGLIEEDENTKFATNEVDGTEVHSIQVASDFGFIPEPIWFLRDGRLCIGLDQETVEKWITTPTEPLSADESFQQLLAQARQAGLEQPLSVSRVDFASAIRLLMSFSSMLGMADAPFKASDLPPTEVLINGLEPSVSLTFRTADGFEILARQTIPSAAPGATLASAAVFGAPRVLRIQTAAKQSMSKNNMRQIMVATHFYHDAHLALPALFNQDKTGKPLLSWRVHILPYIEQDEFYKQFHLDEPWDSEHNIKLVEKMPEVFRHPKLKLEPGQTAYVGLIGLHMAWQLPKDDKQMPTGMTLEAIRDLDGCGHTIALVEVNAEHAVVWTKPEDLNIDDLELIEKLTGIWQKGMIFSTWDASIRSFPSIPDDEKLRQLFRVDDGKHLGTLEIEFGR